MKQVLMFDFQVDKENNTLTVKREFDAPLDMVWEAWTNHRLLDLWWAPKPYQTITKSQNFTEGGTWLYYMQGPDSTIHYCKADYQKIDHHHFFEGLDAFCDENGIINDAFPRTKWHVSFEDIDGKTLVIIHNTFNSLEDLEKIIQLGFKEGFTMAMGNLDQYIEAQHVLRATLKTGHAERVCTYLNFPGNTEQAFLFYKQVFRSSFNGGMQRFGDIPQEPGNPPVEPAVKQMILHVELPILGNHVLMATDAPKEMGFTVTPGNNMHISLEPNSRQEAQRIFTELSLEGTITLPLQDMFWGALFGSFTDKFGINWMINCYEKK